MTISQRGISAISQGTTTEVAALNELTRYSTAKPSVSQDFKRWRYSLSAAKNGDRNSRLLVIGDSTEAGSGANGTAGYPAGSNSRTVGPMYQLADLFRGAGYSAYTDSCVGGQNAQAYYLWDTRFVAGDGWATGATTSATLATTFSRPHHNNTTTNPLTFTPDLDVDTIIVHYVIRTLAGSFTWSLDGGTANNVSVQGAANAVGTVTVSAGSVGAHTLSLARVSGSIYILAVEAYDSTKTGVNIIQMGGSGLNMSNLQAVANPWDALNFVNYLQPDLVVINLVINNWILNVNLDTYKGYIQNIITFLAANQIPVVFVTGYPTQVDWVGPNGVIPLAMQQSYVTALKQVCDANSAVYLDSFARFGSQEDAIANGFYTDYTHPNKHGYFDGKKLVFDYISRI